MKTLTDDEVMKIWHSTEWGTGDIPKFTRLVIDAEKEKNIQVVCEIHNFIHYPDDGCKFCKGVQ